jgi:uncharacterized membrane protein YdjX (TVP38/TMEM64 family)
LENLFGDFVDFSEEGWFPFVEKLGLLLHMQQMDGYTKEVREWGLAGAKLTRSFVVYLTFLFSITPALIETLTQGQIYALFILFLCFCFPVQLGILCLYILFLCVRHIHHGS